MYGYTPEALARVVRFNQDTRLIRVTSPLSPEPFVVARFQGSEFVSRPFTYDVELLSPDAHLELKQLVGQPLMLNLQTPAGDRQFHGYVREFARTGTDGGLARYRASVSPWFAFLEHSANCRIFQALSVVEIVEQVFEGYSGLATVRYDVTAGAYPKLSYCVQYNESDFAFVSRLLEDAGIHYFFEHNQEGHTMVLADDSTTSKPIDHAPRVAWQAEQGVQVENGLDHWATRRRVGSNVQSLKSFDFKQPRSPLAADRLLDIPSGVLPKLETYRYDGAARYADSRIGEALAGLRAQEEAWQTKLFEGAGSHRLLQAGRHFELYGHYDHTEAESETREFLLLEVHHEARNNFNEDFDDVVGGIYRCQVTCLRRKIAYRPLRNTPRPRMPGPQTATVVGPPGEEIHADKYGRVKVQFHWDRLGRFDESSSCWVRVASPWAGSGMGGVSAPRIGQEVVVDFLDGDPDRPIITGRVYNEDNMPPFGLEVSGMKSRTVKGEGHNEVTMHDGAGKQLLNMHAQRDMATTVQNDQTASVKNNKSTDVANNHTMSVGVDQTISVGGKRGISVTGDDSLTVTGARTSTVTGMKTSTVKGPVTETFETGQTLTIPGVGYTETITGPLKTTLTGPYTSTRSGGPWTETIEGPAEWTVAKKLTETLQSGRNVNVNNLDKRHVEGVVEDSNVGERTVTVTGNLTHFATGTQVNASKGDMAVVSDSLVAMGVGEASGISITSGEITISSGGSTIVINAAGVTVNGAKINLN
ncbi:type VI secretion system Vgr family protein [Montanilutibacter psychrotolerans]|uniref:type VI secretion system Vgr family protein n=1 Tax=Montanilutibacter psychrotolerans TaxID=1327343 RepID=UPI001CC1C246|nr:type VI secretion system tip protein TssI/VgrG [Lysobacter psychrotolerans]